MKSLNFDNWLEQKKQEKIGNDVIHSEDLLAFIQCVKELLFPGFFECFGNINNYLDNKVKEIKVSLGKLVTEVDSIEEIKLNENVLIDEFINELPNVDALLKTDIEALFDGDPAAQSKTEIILCYPGLTAIIIYRIAHILNNLNIPILPRALSEHAHSVTGIDIHPGAKIGAYFFIDHGTGIVIGQTCEIGEHVKIYQGVTLGALSLREGQKLKGTKRHPTIKDHVTIYSGASIFGGETVIGKNTTIGSNAFITSSIEDDMSVSISGQKKKHINKID